MTADPLVLVAEVGRATDRLVATARTLDDDALARPSLLPGWSRGHVLAHVARNADSCTNLLTWARTGVETPQYPSAGRRDADIEAGARRQAAEHTADLEATAARFAEVAALMPPEAWRRTVRWLTGRSGPAAGVMWSRLREVELHHVDLDAGYAPADWPDGFTHRLLHELVNSLAGPQVQLRAMDLGHGLAIGSPDSASPSIAGPGHALAAWLSGRGSGAGLSVTPDGPLPPVPAWK